MADGTLTRVLGAHPAAEVLVWGIAVILVVLVMAMVTMYLRKRARETVGRSKAGLSIEKLENLHSSGQITDQEFQTLRQTVLGLSRQDGRKPQESLSPHRQDDDADREGVAEDARAEPTEEDTDN